MTNPIGQSTGWKQITQDCTGAAGGGLADIPHNANPDNGTLPNTLKVTGELTLADSPAPNSDKPRPGQAVFKIWASKSGPTSYKLTCSGGREWEGSLPTAKVADHKYQAVGAQNFQVDKDRADRLRAAQHVAAEARRDRGGHQAVRDQVASSGCRQQRQDSRPQAANRQRGEARGRPKPRTKIAPTAEDQLRRRQGQRQHLLLPGGHQAGPRWTERLPLHEANGSTGTPRAVRRAQTGARRHAQTEARVAAFGWHRSLAAATLRTGGATRRPLFGGAMARRLVADRRHSEQPMDPANSSRGFTCASLNRASDVVPCHVARCSAAPSVGRHRPSAQARD